MVERGVEIDHVTVFRWVQRLTPLLADAARLTVGFQNPSGACAQRGGGRGLARRPRRPVHAPGPRQGGREGRPAATGRYVGKVALVTGAASGLGQATAQCFATEDAQVGCLDLTPAGLP